MAKRSPPRSKAAAKRTQSQTARLAVRLQEAEAALRANDWAKAMTAARAALRAGADPQTEARAREVVVEVLFRQAAVAPPWERLALLDQAMQQAPQQARLHYHRALTLWRMGQSEAATKALRATAETEQRHPALVYLRELGNVAAGRSFNRQGLSVAEQNTLTLLAQLQAGKATKPKGAQPAVLSDALLRDAVLLGDAALWAIFLELYDSKTATAGPPFAALLAAQPTLAVNPVVRYVQGLLALRQGDPLAAQTQWGDLAMQLATPWFVENLRLARRERATTLAQAEDWQGIATLYEQARQDTKAEEIDSAFREIAGYAYFHLGFHAAQAREWARAYGHFTAADGLIKNRLLSQNLALAAEALEDWAAAATAWREMVRRRPRKTDHPDYLTDAQVAAIWQRAAHCHLQAEDSEEGITCLKNAVKYAPADLKLRLALVQLLMTGERLDAAENEIDRILAQDADYVPALVRKGFLSTNRWDRDPMPIWKRVLTLEPANEEARQALARLYLEISENPFLFQHHYGMHKRLDDKMAIQVLQDGLRAVPRHPQLVLELGRRYQEIGEAHTAREHYQDAIRLAPANVQIVGVALHELLHVDGGALVRTLTPQVRQIQGLRPAFWISQGTQALHCELGDEWGEFFWQIAQESAQSLRGDDSPAVVLLMIWSVADAEAAGALAKRYAEQIQRHYPHSGALEYIEAVQKFSANPNKLGPVRTALRKAKSNAQKASESGIVKIAEALEERIAFGGLFSLFGGGAGRGHRANPFAGFFDGPDRDDDDFDFEDLF